ncbi:sigma factor [Brevibacillus laterosporus]|uniref:sigma factor n=1 Tax=Brevibacillus laterosporus TaxID=1465 RepID=UPI001F08B8DF|nr:sigma factor [Brevibacillus laterosporus]
MLGSLTDAEDIVQDTFLQLQRTDISYITNAKSYLSKMVTNRCINEMKSARKKEKLTKVLGYLSLLSMDKS